MASIGVSSWDRNATPIHVWLLEGLCVFDEMVVILYEALKQRGYVNVTRGPIPYPHKLNICLGAASAPHSVIDAQLSRVIIVNYEQLYLASRFLTPDYIHLMRIYPVWEFSECNQQFLREHYGIASERIALNYTPAMKCVHREDTDKCDIHVLFLGVVEGRRLALYERLIHELPHLHIVFKCGVWGDERADLIRRSKIVLNVHTHPAALLEWPRISFLLANKSFVISEHASDESQYMPWIQDALVFCDYDAFPSTILTHLYSRTNPDRKCIATKGYDLVAHHLAPAVLPPNASMDTYYAHYAQMRDHDASMEHGIFPILLTRPLCDVDHVSYLTCNTDVAQHVRAEYQYLKHDNKKDEMHIPAMRHFLRHGCAESYRAMLLSALPNEPIPDIANESEMKIALAKRIIALTHPQPHVSYDLHVQYRYMMPAMHNNVSTFTRTEHNMADSMDRGYIVLHEIASDTTRVRLVVDGRFARNYPKGDVALTADLHLLGIATITFEDEIIMAPWIGQLAGDTTCTMLASSTPSRQLACLLQWFL